MPRPKRQIARERKFWHTNQQRQKGAEQDHLGDEHPFAAEDVRESAEENGANQDAEEARGTDDALLGRADVEFAHDQRQRNAGHEDDESLKELSRCRERPDTPLHGGHGRRLEGGAVGPHGKFVYIVLDRFWTGAARRSSIGENGSFLVFPRRLQNFCRDRAVSQPMSFQSRICHAGHGGTSSGHVKI